MKKVLLFLAAMVCFGAITLPAENADAHWRYRRYKRFKRTFRPVFSMTASGGLHFVDVYDTNSNYLNDSYAFAYGMAEVGGHLWIHPNLSLDLNVGGHFVTPQGYDNRGWGYVSIKPGIRARMRWFYVRGALDITAGADDARRNSAVLFGFLLGVGARVKVTRRLRLFAEIDYQYLFADRFYMPFYGQLGLEFMF